MLNNVVPTLSQHYEIQANGAFRRAWWAQDGAPAHRQIIVRDRLQELFMNRVLPLATCFYGVISNHVCINTSTGFGNPPQKNHGGSAFIAARHGSSSRDGYGISCSFMH